jgi:4-hydroxy-tetrahydrodipicolinate synthase
MRRTAVVNHPASWLAGYIPDLPTPFNAQGDVDLDAFRRLCERQIEAGLTALVVGETTGEASTLTPDEQSRIIRAAVEAAGGRAHIIAGAGSNSTNQAIELTRRAEEAGADAALSVVPYYNKPMQTGIEAHFRAIADETALPIILHDIPGRTIRALADDTLARLAQSSRFVGLLDSSGDVTRPPRLHAVLPAGFRLLSGDDATALPFIASGGEGCISAIATVAPNLCRTIYACCRHENWQSARALHGRLTPLASALAKESPAALKSALHALGLMHPGVRLPLVELDAAPVREVARLIAAVRERDFAAAC